MTDLERLYDREDPYPVEHPDVTWREKLPRVGYLRDGPWFPRWYDYARKLGRESGRRTHDPATDIWIREHITRPIAYRFWRFQTGRELSKSDLAGLTRIYLSYASHMRATYDERMLELWRGQA
jgi:hypothetical protein